MTTSSSLLSLSAALDEGPEGVIRTSCKVAVQAHEYHVLVHGAYPRLEEGGEACLLVVCDYVENLGTIVLPPVHHVLASEVDAVEELHDQDPASIASPQPLRSQIAKLLAVKASIVGTRYLQAIPSTEFCSPSTTLFHSDRTAKHQE
jgi:hypothetical protein